MQQYIFCLPLTSKSLESRKMRLVLPASWSEERGSTGRQPNWGKQGQASAPQAKPDTPLSIKLMIVNVKPNLSGGRQSQTHNLSWSWWRSWCRWSWHCLADAPPYTVLTFPFLLLHQVSRHPSRKGLVCFSIFVQQSFLNNLLNYENYSRKMKHAFKTRHKRG